MTIDMKRLRELVARSALPDGEYSFVEASLLAIPIRTEMFEVCGPVLRNRGGTESRILAECFTQDDAECVAAIVSALPALLDRLDLLEAIVRDRAKGSL